MRPRSLKPLESDDQEMWFSWTRYVHIVAIDPALVPSWLVDHAPHGDLLRHHCYAVPNGAKRTPWEAREMLRTGLTPGVPDVCVDVPSGGSHGLRIEVKRRGNNRPTEEQMEQIALRKRMGYAACVAEGFDEARSITLQYLRPSWRVIDRWVG